MSEAGVATRSVVIEKVFGSPREKVWRALAEGELMAQWLVPNDFRAVVGHRFQFRMPPMPHWDGVIESEVLVVEPEERLSYTWNALGLESVVEWTLTTTDSGTRVRMEQSGFPADHEAAIKGATYGWQKFIGNLERVVAEISAGGNA